MENINVEVEALTSKLQSTTIPNGSGVSFVGQGLKLNNADDAKSIVNEINKADQVEFLNMEGNSLGVDAAKEIGKALEKRKEFKRALWKDMFTSRLKTEIPIALKHLTGGLMLAGARLEVLDLSDNASGPIGVEGFEEFLRSPSCYTLRELRLNNMGLGVTGAKKLASALLDLYNNSKNAGEPLQLEVFIAGRNRLENPGASALAQVFQKIGTLREISIPQNGIYHYGISALSAAFNENLTLEVINLNDNTVTEKGARALSKALCNLKNLKSLDLGDCLLRSEGALAISESVCKLKNLETLNLSFNEVKAEAGSRVLNTLAPLSSCLSTLNMDGNMFGPSMCDEITSVAQQLKLPLASLNEDEGGDGDEYDDDEQVDDEEDEEDDEDGEEEEEEDLDDTESDQPYNLDDEYDEESDGENSADISSGVSPMRAAMKPPQPLFQQVMMDNTLSSVVANFLSNATKENYNRIPDPKAETIINDIKKRYDSVERRCEEMIHSVVVVAGLHASSDAQVKESVMRTSIALFQEITAFAETTKTTNILNERIPVHFGYLKDEDTNKKKDVPERDSCLRILHAAISSHCLPQQTISLLNSIEACIKV